MEIICLPGTPVQVGCLPFDPPGIKVESLSCSGRLRVKSELPTLRGGVVEGPRPHPHVWVLGPGETHCWLQHNPVCLSRGLLEGQG